MVTFCKHFHGSTQSLQEQPATIHHQQVAVSVLNTGTFIFLVINTSCCIAFWNCRSCCIWGNWSAWSACSATCDGGQMSRNRKVGKLCVARGFCVCYTWNNECLGVCMSILDAFCRYCLVLMDRCLPARRTASVGVLQIPIFNICSCGPWLACLLSGQDAGNGAM